MPEYVDIYSLVQERKEEAILQFLDRFAPHREECADEYEIPQHASAPQLVFKSAQELIKYCCLHPREAHSIYWRNLYGNPAYVMAFFLSGGQVIYGVSAVAENGQGAGALQSQLLEFTGASKALVRWEQPPPETEEAFIQALAVSA